MRHLRHRTLRLSLLAALALSLSACGLLGPSVEPKSSFPAKPTVTPDQQIAHIRAAGEREKSVIDVNPLGDPGITHLQTEAAASARAGNYPDAAAKLDQAIRLSPDSPDLLQDRAEIDIRMNRYAEAQTLAQKSWELGPKLGPLCARNQQTLVEARLQAGDTAGAAAARKGVTECHKPAVPRY